MKCNGTLIRDVAEQFLCPMKPKMRSPCSDPLGQGHPEPTPSLQGVVARRLSGFLSSIVILTTSVLTVTGFVLTLFHCKQKVTGRGALGAIRKR